jgi:hypothetical protein
VVKGGAMRAGQETEKSSILRAAPAKAAHFD